MFLLSALLVGLLSWWVIPDGGIADVPFGQLTLRLIMAQVIGVLLAFAAWFLLLKSWEHDRIWPWKWTWPYFVNLMARTLSIAAYSGFVFWFTIQDPRAESWGILRYLIWATWPITVLFCMFSDEFDFLKDSQSQTQKDDQDTDCQSSSCSSLYSLDDEFGSTLSDLEAEFDFGSTLSDLEDTLPNFISELEQLINDCMDKLDSMPEQSQDASTVQILEDRIDDLEGWIIDLEAIEIKAEDGELPEDAFNRIKEEIAYSNPWSTA